MVFDFWVVLGIQSMNTRESGVSSSFPTAQMDGWESCRGRSLFKQLHVNCGQLATLQTQGNPVLFLLVQRQNRLAHQAAGENATLYQSFLQAGMSLTRGLAAAVDSLGDVVNSVRPILSFLQSVLFRVGEDFPCGADQLRHAAP